MSIESSETEEIVMSIVNLFSREQSPSSEKKVITKQNVYEII
jgi:hypothetical protein